MEVGPNEGKKSNQGMKRIKGKRCKQGNKRKIWKTPERITLSPDLPRLAYVVERLDVVSLAFEAVDSKELCMIVVAYWWRNAEMKCQLSPTPASFEQYEKYTTTIVWVDGESYTSPNTFQQRKLAEEDPCKVALFAIMLKLKKAKHYIMFNRIKHYASRILLSMQ
ncbi:hypothetical protein LXL04_003268 [Taraxacum kok-saghyz]